MRTMAWQMTTDPVRLPHIAQSVLRLMAFRWQQPSVSHQYLNVVTNLLRSLRRNQALCKPSSRPLYVLRRNPSKSASACQARKLLRPTCRAGAPA